MIFFQLLLCYLWHLSVAILEFISYNTNWSEGRHFCTGRLDTKRTTQDSGVMATFENANGKTEDFCGIFMRILKFNYRTFNIYALDAKWFNEPLRISATITRHPSGVLAINSTRFGKIKIDSLVVTQHCDQVLLFHYFLLGITFIMSFYFFIIKFQGCLPSGY